MGIEEESIATGHLSIMVYDKDLLSNDSIGEAKVSLSEIPQNTPQEFSLKVSLPFPIEGYLPC